MSTVFLKSMWKIKNQPNKKILISSLDIQKKITLSIYSSSHSCLGRLTATIPTLNYLLLP